MFHYYLYLFNLSGGPFSIYSGIVKIINLVAYPSQSTISALQGIHQHLSNGEHQDTLCPSFVIIPVNSECPPQSCILAPSSHKINEIPNNITWNVLHRCSMEDRSGDLANLGKTGKLFICRSSDTFIMMPGIFLLKHATTTSKGWENVALENGAFAPNQECCQQLLY